MKSGKKGTPKMSVVMPVFNGEQFITLSIDSILNQSLDEIELLICDDQSTDSTLSIIESYDDPRISIMRNEKNEGIFSTLNKLIKHSQAAWIHLWSQDDIMESECLKQCYRFHEKNPDVAFSFSANNRIDSTNTVLRGGDNSGKRIILNPDDSIPLFLIYGCIPGNISTVTISKKYLMQSGLFNSELKFVGDFDMWVRLAKEYRMGKIASRLVRIRDHAGQASRRPDMMYKKLKESLPLHLSLIQVLPERQKKDGLKVVKWVHRPHFMLVAIHLLKNGQLNFFLTYLKELSKFDNLFLLFLRTSIMRIFRLIRKESSYRKYFFKPFQSHIANFRS